MRLKMNSLGANVLRVVFIIVVCCNNNPEAAPGDSCTSGDTTNCATPGEECDGTNCICSQDYYLNGNVCSPKGNYGENCANTAECKNGLACVDDDSRNKKCLCNDKNFLGPGNTCVSTDTLKPTIQATLTSTHDSVSLSWISPIATGYSTNYIIKYTQGGSQQTTSALGDVSQTTVNGLTPGTSYTFVVSRSITRGGRTQRNIDSAGRDSTTKGNYGENCANTAECKIDLTCVDDDSRNKKCLCNDGSFLGSGNICVSTDTLKSTIQGLTSTHDSVSLSWISPDASGYNNNYIIKYTPQGGSQQATSALGSVLQTTVNGLTPGTSYTFVVSRSITREGRTQRNIDSAGRDYTTKLDYAAICTSTPPCRNGLSCEMVDDQSVRKCLCADGYYTGGICADKSGLKPVITDVTVSTDTARITWNSPTATGYTNSYIIKYSSTEGDRTQSVTGDVSVTTVSGLTPGVQYVFVVSRSITREGRTQSGIDSVGRTDSTDKIDYGQPCTQTGTCKDLNSNCHSDECRCDPGYFRNTNQCQNNDVLKPLNVQTQRLSTRQIRVTWTSPGYTGTGFNGYELDVTPSVSQGDISITDTTATLSSLTPGERYTITVKTKINYLNRDERAAADSVSEITKAGKVDQLQAAATSITSRSVYVMWKRPKTPNGNIYQYSLQAINNGKCVQQIILNCTACNRTEMITNQRSDTVCDNTVNIIISEEDIENDDYLVFHNVTGLLPDITYTIKVSAYNEEGKGVPASLARRTLTEAAGEPTSLESPDQTSSSILLTWTPPVPRPGTTGYTIKVYEREENSQKYELFNTSNITGYDINSFNVTGLSSYWDYNFTIVAFTVVGSSQLVQLPPVKTKESVPTEIEDLKSSAIKGVYDQIQLSWKCPKQKDGRNGEITFSTVNYTTLTTSKTVNLRQGFVRFPVTQDCAWTERLKVTAEFNYTFQVYVSNRGFDGLPTNIVVYIAAGPPSFTNTPAVLLESGETGAVLEICRPCILNNKNGEVVKTGLILCKVGSCPSQLTIGDYDSLPNWNTATGNNFNALFRATSNDWLNDDLSNDAGRFSLGNEACDVGDQNRYCNGPLPVANTFRVWIFACTRAGCTTSNYIDVELRAKDKSFPVSIIAAIACVTVAVIAIGVIVTVYLKIIKPRSKKTSTKYKTTTSPDQKEDTYEEIKGGQRLSVIQDGRQDVDYYNTRGSLPQADNTYDQLAPYFNADQHDYGKINVTQT